MERSADVAFLILKYNWLLKKRSDVGPSQLETRDDLPYTPAVVLLWKVETIKNIQLALAGRSAKLLKKRPEEPYNLKS
jgi:hypothetical protein